MALLEALPKNLNDVSSKLSGLNQQSIEYLVTPFAGFGIAGFKFSAFKQYKAELRSNITDNYSEKNIALHDNIALEPEMYSLSGMIGEISYEYKGNQASQINKIAQKLTTITGFLPALSATMKTMHNFINTKIEPSQAYTDATLGTALDLYQTYQKLNPPQTAQAKAYNFFLALRNARVLISFETPYGFKTNYAIANLVMTQPDYTDTRSDVEVVLKEFRYAQTSQVPFDPDKYELRSQQQNQPVADKGSTQGVLETRGAAFFQNSWKLNSSL